MFVFGGIALALLPGVLKEQPGYRGWMAWAACCAPVAASFCFLYDVSLKAQQDPELYHFWAQYFPDYHRPWLVPWWLVEQLYGLCNHTYKPFGFVMLPLAVLGVVGWWRAGMRERVAVLMTPVVLTIAAAGLHQYPFGGTRVTQFLVPAVLLLSAEGVVELARRLPARSSRWAWLAAAPTLLSGGWQAGYHLVVPRCTSHLRPAVQWVQARYEPGDSILVVGANTWPVFYVYWPDPPAGTVVVPDGTTVRPAGRFWCVCEYAPGEFSKKRKPTVDLASAGASPIHSGDFVGRGGAAFLFDRPTPSTDPSTKVNR